MRGFLVRWVIGALALWVASVVVPGMEIHGATNFLLAALLLGLVNAIVRPIVLLLTLPLTILTLGLFLLVVNALMLKIVSWLFDPLSFRSFGSAVLAAIVVSLVNWFTASWIGPKGKFEVLVVRRREAS